MSFINFLVRVIRLLAIILGIVVFLLFSFAIFQTPVPDDGHGIPDSIWGRFLIYLPFQLFGVVLAVPYRSCKHKWPFIGLLVALLIYLALVILYGISASVDHGDVDTYKVEPITLIITVVYLLNLWSFLRITNRIKLSYVFIYSILVLTTGAAAVLHFAPANFDIPKQYSWQSDYGTNLAKTYDKEIVTAFMIKERLPESERRNIRKLYEKVETATQYRGRFISFDLIIRVGDVPYLVRVKGRRYWIRQFNQWEIISSKRF